MALWFIILQDFYTDSITIFTAVVFAKIVRSLDWLKGGLFI